ncbi:MAG: dTMP kinase [Gluconacetobacter diazotrophicus]|nr:dTMP kinase [Gluconacetobacter diazotrophicus]
MSGFFLSLEGGEGAGKTTQIAALAERLAGSGRAVVRTREPGGSPAAERLRLILLGAELGVLAPRAEVALHFAARLDHLERTVLPALARGAVVLCDRFADSTAAYQGYGQGHGDPGLLEFIARQTALLPVRPALTILLELPRPVARARVQRRGGALDRYETQDEAFHRRVADGFRRIAAAEPERVVTVDGAAAPDAVAERVWAELRARLPN